MLQAIPFEPAPHLLSTPYVKLPCMTIGTETYGASIGAQQAGSTTGLPGCSLYLSPLSTFFLFLVFIK
jgi:hypothetical protein